MEIVTTLHGINLPLVCNAFFTAYSIPPQHGTSIRTTVTLLIRKGDLLVCEGGDIGRSAIWPFDDDIRIQNHIHRLRPYGSLNNRFYYYVMFLWKQCGFIGGQGIGLQGFSSKALHKLMVPLPPLNEQNQIVEYIDDFNEILSNIENSLN